MILTTSQYKLDKSMGHGYKTVGLNLSPADEMTQVLGINAPTMCAMAGACAAGCLAKTGMNVFPQSIQARAERTKLWVRDPKRFVMNVLDELDVALTKATRDSMQFAMRPNLLSDQRKLAVQLATDRPHVQFYDYTKLPHPISRTWQPSNYHLTYSVSERTTPATLRRYLNEEINPAIVFDTPRGAPLPSHYTVLGQKMPVIDGDAHDLRFLDPVGVVVGLRWKGSKARLADALAGGFAFSATAPGLPGKLA